MLLFILFKNKITDKTVSYFILKLIVTDRAVSKTIYQLSDFLHPFPKNRVLLLLSVLRHVSYSESYD